MPRVPVGEATPILGRVRDVPISADLEQAGRARGPLGALGFFAACWLAIAIPYLLSALGLGGVEALAGAEPGTSIQPLLRFNLIYAAVIALLVTSLRIEGRAIRRDVEALRALVVASEEEWRRWRAMLVAPARSRIVVWAACGAALGILITVIGHWLAPVRVGVWYGHYVWMTLLAMLLFGLLVVLAGWGVGRARAFLEMGRRARVDLLDPGALAPFARAGLRAAAYWFLGTSIATLLVIDSGTWGIVAAVNSVTLAIGVFSLLLPSRGVHESLRAARARELRRVRGELDQLRARILTARSDAAEAARMQALLAWEARVAAMPVWPFDTPTVARFLLILLVPLGSWLGGALVERLVERFLP